MSNIAERKIDEEMVRYFVWSVWNFFSTTSRVEPQVEAPYLLASFSHNDFTGVIGVSGSQQGSVYITMSRALLAELYQDHYAATLGAELGASDEAELEDLLTDLAGEIANTISGNVRNFLGENFLISTPVVFQNSGTSLSLPPDCPGIVLPIRWESHTCHLIVGLKHNELLNL